MTDANAPGFLPTQDHEPLDTQETDRPMLNERSPRRQTVDLSHVNTGFSQFTRGEPKLDLKRRSSNQVDGNQFMLRGTLQPIDSDHNLEDVSQAKSKVSSVDISEDRESDYMTDGEQNAHDEKIR